jgi:hypothetical protein
MSKTTSDLTCNESMPPFDADSVVDTKRFPKTFLPPQMTTNSNTTRHIPSPHRNNGAASTSRAQNWHYDVPFSDIDRLSQQIRRTEPSSMAGSFFLKNSLTEPLNANDTRQLTNNLIHNIINGPLAMPLQRTLAASFALEPQLPYSSIPSSSAASFLHGTH